MEVLVLEVGEEADLVLLPAGEEEGPRLVDRQAAPLDRPVLLDERTHPLLDLAEFLRAERGAVLHPAEVPAVRDGVVDEHARLGKESVGGDDEQEGEAAGVDPHPVRVREEDGGDVRVARDGPGQLAQGLPDDRRHGRVGLAMGEGGAEKLDEGGLALPLEHAPVRKADLDGLSQLSLACLSSLVWHDVGLPRRGELPI